MSRKPRYYAAYGSNINVDQMAYRCPDARIVCKSWLHDHKLVFQGYNISNAHANVIQAPGEAVPLLIWDISPGDERSLDFYEGVRGGYYTKETVEVEILGEIKDALIYIMAPNPYGIPSNAYYKGIWSGYREFGFQTSILSEARLEAERMCNKKEAGA